MENPLPVSVLISNGDDISRTAVGKVIEDALRTHGFENVHFTRQVGDTISMLDAVAKMVPAHFKAGVDIAAYEGYQYKPSETAREFLRGISEGAVNSALSAWPQIGTPAGDLLAAEMTGILRNAEQLDHQKAIAIDAAVAKGVEVYHASLKELFQENGPLAALEMANAALKAGGMNVQVREMTLDNDVHIKSF